MRDRNELNQQLSATRAYLQMKVVLKYPEDVRKRNYRTKFAAVLGCPERHKSTLKIDFDCRTKVLRG